jgi:hypothetical protein
MKKRLLWPGIAVLVLSLLAWMSSSGAATVSIPNTQVPTGTATIQVPIQVNQANGIAGVQFGLVFDPTVLQATGWSKGSLTSGTFWNPVANSNLPGQMMIGAYGFDAGPPPEIISLAAGSGSLVEIIFNVRGGDGDYTYVSLTGCKLSDSAGTEIASTCLAGRVSIGEDTQRELYLPLIFKNFSVGQ